MSDLDPDKIMAEHQRTANPVPNSITVYICAKCHDLWPCLPYRLAAENVALRAAIGRVKAIANRGASQESRETDRLREVARRNNQVITTGALLNRIFLRLDAAEAEAAALRAAEGEQ